jgi:predicted nucleic acid-binding protein
LIAADTSSLIAYFGGDQGGDVEAIDAAMEGGTLHLPPVVVTELLSDFKGRSIIEAGIIDSPMLEILPGFWQRAGATRASLLAKGIAAKLPDTLIAQSCIDHNVPLITRDTDFRHFAKHCGLKLA